MSAASPPPTFVPQICRFGPACTKRGTTCNRAHVPLTNNVQNYVRGPTGNDNNGVLSGGNRVRTMKPPCKFRNRCFKRAEGPDQCNFYHPPACNHDPESCPYLATKNGCRYWHDQTSDAKPLVHKHSGKENIDEKEENNAESDNPAEELFEDDDDQNTG